MEIEIGILGGTFLVGCGFLFFCLACFGFLLYRINLEDTETVNFIHIQRSWDQPIFDGYIPFLESETPYPPGDE